jgi:hypothetical protein
LTSAVGSQRVGSAGKISSYFFGGPNKI